MKSKLKNLLLKLILPLCFWLIIWQLLATVVSDRFLLPDVAETLSAIFDLLGESTFYSAVLLSLIRVVLGLILGIIAGCLLAFACSKFEFIKALILPLISIIKSTPVASFIVVLWVLMSGDALSIFIGFLMVMPIIFQNVSDGLLSIDKGLLEVADVFEFSREKRFMLITLPAVKKYLIPGVITSTGLAWKAEIAAEIIASTRNSIGQGINDAKFDFDTPTVFAWTVIIILFSLCLEGLTAFLLRRAKK